MLLFPCWNTDLIAKIYLHACLATTNLRYCSILNCFSSRNRNHQVLMSQSMYALITYLKHKLHCQLSFPYRACASSSVISKRPPCHRLHCTPAGGRSWSGWTWDGARGRRPSGSRSCKGDRLAPRPTVIARYRNIIEINRPLSKRHHIGNCSDMLTLRFVFYPPRERPITNISMSTFRTIFETPSFRFPNDTGQFHPLLTISYRNPHLSYPPLTHSPVANCSPWM